MLQVRTQWFKTELTSSWAKHKTFFKSKHGMVAGAYLPSVPGGQRQQHLEVKVVLIAIYIVCLWSPWDMQDSASDQNPNKELTVNSSERGLLQGRV